jgi:hypothetical protein
MTQINTSELDNAIQDLGSSISNIINRALTVDDMRMQSLTSVEFNAEEGKGVYGKGLQWKGDGPTKQLIYRSSPDRIWTSESIDIANESSYMIGNTPVLRQTELGSSVRTSSLVTVGTLQNLRTQGSLSIDDYTNGPVKFENKKFLNGSGIPTSGTYRQGDIVWNENPVSTSYIGWVCVKAGTPGEWKPFGQIG